MKILKWILGLLAGIVGIVAMFGGQSKKEIKRKSNKTRKRLVKKLKRLRI